VHPYVNAKRRPVAIDKTGKAAAVEQRAVVQNVVKAAANEESFKGRKKKKINTFREIHFLFTSVLEVDRIVDSATETAVGERGEDARCDVQLGDTACKGAGDVELGGVLAHGENLGDRVRGDRRGNHWNST